MRLFSKKDKCIEEEIDLLFEDEKEHLKRWKKVKIESFFVRLSIAIFWLFWVGMLMFDLWDNFTSETHSNITMPSSPVFLVILLLIFYVDNMINDEFRFLAMISVMKRKIKKTVNDDSLPAAEEKSQESTQAKEK